MPHLTQSSLPNVFTLQHQNESFSLPRIHICHCGREASKRILHHCSICDYLEIEDEIFRQDDIKNITRNEDLVGSNNDRSSLTAKNKNVLDSRIVQQQTRKQHPKKEVTKIRTSTFKTSAGLSTGNFTSDNDKSIPIPATIEIIRAVTARTTTNQSSHENKMKNMKRFNKRY